jgi:predicted small secreted protein
VITLDSTTRAAYLAESTLADRAQAVLDALADPVSIKVYNGASEVGSGTMATPWATRNAGVLTTGEVTSFAVTSSGTPGPGWTLRFESGSRWIRGTFGLTGSGSDFEWSLPTWSAGQSGRISTIVINATNEGLVTVTGTGAITLGEVTVAGTGTAVGTITGTGAITLAPVTVSGDDGSSYDPATTRYVRAGSGGSANGLDWTNAYTSLPASLTRGYTYYVADGSYSGYTFDDAASGTTVITIKKATVASHGTSTGWSDGYGDGDAAFGAIVISTSYNIIDGLSSSDIRVNAVTGAQVRNCVIDGGWIHFEPQSNSNGSQSCVIYGNRLFGVESPDGDAPQIQVFGTNHLIENNEIGPSSDIDAFRLFGTGHIVRGNYVHDITYSTGSSAHMDMIQTFGDNGWVANDILIENNVFTDSEGQLFNLSQDNVSGIGDWTFRNNVFANISQNANFGIPNIKFYNNTLYQVGVLYLVTGGPGQPFNATGLDLKNNLFIGLGGNNTDWDEVLQNPSGQTMTRSYNLWAQTSGAAMLYYSAETGGINGGTLDFVDAAGGDFHIGANSTAIDAGTTLADVPTDADGGSRPSGSAYDIGAYEYGSS